MLDSKFLSVVLAAVLVAIGVFMIVTRRQPFGRKREGALGAADRRHALPGGIIFLAAGIALILSFMFPGNNLPTSVAIVVGIAVAGVLDYRAR